MFKNTTNSRRKYKRQRDEKQKGKTTGVKNKKKRSGAHQDKYECDTGLYWEDDLHDRLLEKKKI